jgi:hypothetical protein
LHTLIRQIIMSDMPTFRCTMIVATGAVMVAVSGCTSAAHTAKPEPSTSPSTGVVASGVITGYVQACSGLPGARTQLASVRVVHGGATVASVAIIAGSPAHDRYRVTVPPGIYNVTATNWFAARNTIVVTSGAQVAVDFPNSCK